MVVVVAAVVVLYLVVVYVLVCSGSMRIKIGIISLPPDNLRPR